MDDPDTLPGTILPRSLFAELIAAQGPLAGNRERCAVRALSDPVSNHNGAKQALEICCAEHRQRIFVKSLAVGVSEAASYRIMMRAGAPVASLIASQVHGQREVIVIEHLGHIAIDPGTAGEFADYLDVLAQFQACAAADLPQAEPQWIRRWLGSLQEAWRRSRCGAWGLTLQVQASVLDGQWPGLQHLADGLASALERFPRVPTHHDPAYGNVGRLRPDTRLVLFDLQYCNLHPWGRDLALALGGFAQAWPDANGRGPWIERFCMTYNRTAAHPVSCTEAQTAVTLHLAAYRCWCDELTLQAAETALRRDPEHFQITWGSWLGRTWTQLHDWVHRGTLP